MTIFAPKVKGCWKEPNAASPHTLDSPSAKSSLFGGSRPLRFAATLHRIATITG